MFIVCLLLFKSTAIYLFLKKIEIMKVETATLEDLDQIVELFDAYRVFYRKESDKKGAKVFLKSRITNHESIIYYAKNDNDKYVGFAQLYPVFSSTNMKRIWLLNDLYVVEKARGLGVSKLLIDRCKDLARQTNALGLSLETELNNEIGNNLYPKVGFQLDTEHNFYFWSTK